MTPKDTTSRGILLASFMVGPTEDEVMDEVQAIIETLELTNKYIFMFEEEKNPQRKILTYNSATIPKGASYNPRLYTMRVHRKKQTNTLYTINALNLALAKDNDGKFGKDFALEWERYRETIMLSVHGKLQVTSLRIVKIFQIEKD